MLRTSLRGAAALLLAAVWLAAPAPAAWAHAALEGSAPAAGARVEESPRQVVLTFGETPDPTLSIIRVIDARGLPVAGAGDALPVPGEPDQLAVALAEPLPRGVYSVNWLAVSEEDGHVENGTFTFGVRVLPQPGSVVEVPLSHASAWAEGMSAAGHWLLYWGLALLLGATTTGLLVFGGRAPSG
ncbi:MAG: copper resistance CopC family protein, partial [Thermoleophilia bacterium]